MNRKFFAFAGLGSTLATFLTFVACAAAQTSGFELIYTFTANGDGKNPNTALVVGQGGVLYGTTYSDYVGTPGGDGAVFSLTPPTTPTGTWTENTLFDFNSTTGALPDGGLAIDASGILYGTTLSGGSHSLGVVYSLTPPAQPGGSWTEAMLYNFKRGTTEGYTPKSSVVFGPGGSLYGTTTTTGAVFELVPPSAPGGSWTPYALHVFGSYSGDGVLPGAGLLAGKNGVLYGTTIFGGTYPVNGPLYYGGTVYSVKPPTEQGGKWTEEVLHDFGGSGDGFWPGSILTGDDGVLYGTTVEGPNNGSFGCGVVFSLAPPAVQGGAWTETVLHAFAGGVSDGCGAAAGVTVGSGGVLYGVTGGGGAANYGTIYSLSPPITPGGVWTFTLLHSFNFADGYSPASSLVIGSDGALYGTAQAGGDTTGNCQGNGCGTVFAFKP